jgi:hypothetical protein
MNVIISNLNKDKFSNLDVDVIKSISGEFSADEIVQSFSNFFFNRMFLDITAIEDYTNVANIQKISMGLDVSKIILFLKGDPIVNSSVYISRLISMGIYNFARDEEELMYLYNNPNQYKDVAHLQKVDEELVEVQEEIVSNDVRIIGFKDFTSHAGSTSLIYMLKKQLSKNYYTVCIEVNKRDFMFFRDKDMISTNEKNLVNVLKKYEKANVILIDLNNINDSISLSLCSDVIYLIEPSTLEINKIVMLNSKAFDKLKDFKVVLNDCLFNDKDIKDFGEEAGINIFYSIPPLNDRIDNSKILIPFLAELGLYQKREVESSSNSNKFFKF